jgi:hypothetical protein
VYCFKEKDKKRGKEGVAWPLTAVPAIYTPVLKRRRTNHQSQFSKTEQEGMIGQ